MLKQGLMIVDKFYRHDEFTRKPVPNEASMAWKFEKGLRGDIRSRMSGRN